MTYIRGWDNWNEPARGVLSLAQNEARIRGQLFIDPEHILLAILKEPSGPACRTLTNLGVVIPDLTKDLVIAIAIGPVVTSKNATDPTPSPDCNKVIDRANDETNQLFRARVGTHHLLFALIQDDGVAGQILADSGVTLEAARREAVKLFIPPLTASFMTLDEKIAAKRVEIANAEAVVKLYRRELADLLREKIQPV